MRIAYLFIAHNHPEHLAKTIAKLQTPNAWFYVHIDKKCDQSSFEKAFAGLEARIEFVARRESIFWMGFSMVSVTLELMKLARQSIRREKLHFDYYILLSGVDYPIKSNEEIDQVLSKSESKNYLMFWDLRDLPDWLHKVEEYHYLDSAWHNQRAKPILGGRLRMPFYRIERLRKKAHRFIPKRRLPFNLIPYGGSQWWMLTSDAVAYILDYLEESPEIIRFFRFTHSPDELMIQTILMNSPFKETIHGREFYSAFIKAWKSNDAPDFVTEKARNFNFRYIDWDPAREFPSTLDERDFAAIKSSFCLFARKFDPIRSAELIKMIDTNHQAPQSN